MGDFEMTNKNLTMEHITVIFEIILKEHETSIVQNEGRATRYPDKKIIMDD